MKTWMRLKACRSRTESGCNDGSVRMKRMRTFSIKKTAGRGSLSGKAVPGLLGGRVVLFDRMRRILAVMTVVAFPLALHAVPSRDRKEEPKKTTQVLTDEEREIIQNREVLENLTLLQNFDAIEFMDILNEMDPDWSESETKGPGKMEEGGDEP
jgi:hypothetical protein